MISLRQMVRSALYKVALALHRVGVSPNALTCLSLVLALACGFAITLAAFYIASCLFLLSGVCDLLDGELARSTGRSTRFGALLDSTTDRVSDAAPLLGLIVLYSSSDLRSAEWIPALAILAAGLVSYIRARAEALGVTLPRLWMRRGERMALICVSLVFGSVAVNVGGVELPLTLFGIALLAFLSASGAVIALKAGREALEGQQQRHWTKLKHDANFATGNEDQAECKADAGSSSSQVAPSPLVPHQQPNNPIQTVAGR